MATNKVRTDHSQEVVVQCSCGKRMLALTRYAGKRVKCPACDRAVSVPTTSSPKSVADIHSVEEQTEDMSRAAIIAVWSFVGVFAVGSILFLVSYSRSLDQAAIAAANEAKAIAEKGEQDRQVHQQQLRLIANSNVEKLFDEAIEALEADDVATGQRKIEEALAMHRADAVAHARKLGEQIKNTTDPARIHEALMGLSDEEFQQLRDNGTMPPQLLTNYVALNRRAVELVKADIERVAETRDAPRLVKLAEERAEAEKQQEREIGKQREREKEMAIAKEEKLTGQIIEAYTAAQAFVERQLKSPSTASYGGLFSGDLQDPRKCVKSLGNGEYRVKGWVDSQNSFGATVRTDFELTVKDHGDGNNWSLVGKLVMRQR